MTRSLFAKIFLWVWLAMILIAALSMIVGLSTDAHRAVRERFRERLTAQGQELILAYEQGGDVALAERSATITRLTGHPAYLFPPKIHPSADAKLPAHVDGLVLQGRESGEIQLQESGKGLWLAVPLKAGYVYLTETTPPGPIEQFFDPHRLAQRLLVTFVVTGIICFFLARSLTAPLGRLRRATAAFADGNLATRIGASISGKDEIAKLATDFDRMAERIEALVAAQRTLLRDISHELRSPLTRLTIALELARQKSGNELPGALERIEREAQRLNELISQLTTLTLLECDSAQRQNAPLDLATLLAEVVSDADFEARSRERRCTLSGAQKAVIIPATGELLRQAIENVIRNGIRHTPAGSSVEVSLTADAHAACITVRDHGPGVPPQFLEQIFLPFYRAESARDRQSGGSGIGLAITERAIRLHGGTVHARNAEDGGLLVEMVLPI